MVDFLDPIRPRRHRSSAGRQQGTNFNLRMTDRRVIKGLPDDLTIVMRVGGAVLDRPLLQTANLSGCDGRRISFNEVERYHPFQCLVNGMALATGSCQFGSMFTEPAVPHSLHTRRRALSRSGEGERPAETAIQVMRQSSCLRLTRPLNRIGQGFAFPNPLSYFGVGIRSFAYEYTVDCSQ